MSPSIDMRVGSDNKVNDYHHDNTNGHANGYSDYVIDATEQATVSTPKLVSTNVYDKFNITGKVYIITGGGRGLGLAMAEALVEAGAIVYCFDCLPMPHSEFVAVQKAATIQTGMKPSSRLRYRRVDVRDSSEIDYITSNIAETHGRLDGLIAAAAIQQVTPAIEYTAEQISTMMSINYTGVFTVAAAVARAMMVHQCPGSIVLVASMSGMVANKGLISSVYNSSKAALIQLSKNLAMKWGPRGIRVNSLCPGHIITPMVREHLEEDPGLESFWAGENMLGRLARTDEFKGAGVFLLSEASSFMTGSSLVIDGGHTAW